MGCTSSKGVIDPQGPPRKLRFEDCWIMNTSDMLGEGQFAKVYSAKPAPGHKPPRCDVAPAKVAVKKMEKARLTDEDKAALAIEIQAMQLLSSHPSFVKLYESFDEEAHFYLVLEHIGGGELFDRIVEKEKYSEREAREVIIQMTKAIAFAHQAGVAHRDLKPENILLKERDDDTSIKIADLGFAKVVTPAQPLMTTPCGTPGYVAPEILSGKPYGLQADIWSLGVIFYILLCGYPPFQDDDQRALFEKIKGAKYDFDDEVWAHVSSDAKDLVSRILVADPGRRFKADDILRHPWITADASAISDVALAGTVAQLKRFNARRRLKKAMQGVRSTVRMKMLMVAKTMKAEQEREAAAAGGAAGGAGATATDADGNPRVANVLFNAVRAAKASKEEGDGPRPAEAASAESI